MHKHDSVTEDSDVKVNSSLTYPSSPHYSEAIHTPGPSAKI